MRGGGPGTRCGSSDSRCRNSLIATSPSNRESFAGDGGQLILLSAGAAPAVAGTGGGASLNCGSRRTRCPRAHGGAYNSGSFGFSSCLIGALILDSPCSTAPVDAPCPIDV